MGTQMISMTEKELTQTIQKALRQTGWLSSHFHDSRREIKPNVFIGDRSAKGFPDVVAVKNKRLLVAELKSDKGQLREGQPEWLTGFVEVGAEVFLWRPEHWRNGAITSILTSEFPLKINKNKNLEYGVWEPTNKQQ